MPMFQHIVLFFVVTPTCLAQTTGPETISSQADDIAAVTARANEGEISAQLKLADAYLRGQGVAQNDAEGFRWFLAAAEKGNAEAQFTDSRRARWD
jgi:TPR repeat protein